MTKALFLIAPLVLELEAIREFVRYAWGGDNFLIGIHGSDVWVPFVVALVIFLASWVRKDILSPRFEPRNFILNLVFLLAVGVQTAFTDFLFASIPSAPLWVAVLLVTIAATLVTSFSVFHSWPALLRAIRSQRLSLFWFLVSVLSLLLYPRVLEIFWPVLSKWTTYASAAVLNLLGVGVETLVTPYKFVVSSDRIGIAVNMGCSGLEGLFFFLFSFGLIVSLRPSLVHMRRAVVVVPLGLGMMFAMNVVRITFFFLVALAVENYLGQSRGGRFITWAFHANIGWILYAVALWFFFRVLRRWRWVETAV